MKRSLKKAEKDLEGANKGEGNLKASCKTAQRLLSSLWTKHRAENTAVSSDQENVVSSLAHSGFAVYGVSENMASSIEEIEDNIHTFFPKARQ